MSPLDNGSNGLNELDRCKTCHHNRLWHDNNNPMHPFNDGQAGASAFLGPKKDRKDAGGGTGGLRAVQTAERSPWPMDPVLRMALINKGILTPQDLRDAEEQIRAVTAEFEATVKESRNP